METYKLDQLILLPPESVKYDHRLSVMCAIRAALANENTELPNEKVRKLTSLTHYLCDWPTLQTLQNCTQWQGSCLERVLPDIQMGSYDIALAKLAVAIHKNPDNRQLITAKQELNHLIQYFPYPLAELTHEKISITPLQLHHVADFGWQYGDSKIAELCNLPLFPSAHHWLAWLYLCQQQPERHIFAVIHQDYGFIGSVNLQVFEDTGFFYYWLGKDFQRQGYGPAAVNILLRIGRSHLGMQSCYAKVFDYNLVSNKALSKLGFSRLSLKAVAPSEAEVFYYLGQKKSTSEHYHKLGWLLRQLQSDIQLDMPRRRAGACNKSL